LDYLRIHTSLSPIRRGFAPSFVNYKKGCTQLAATSDKAYPSTPRRCRELDQVPVKHPSIKYKSNTHCRELGQPNIRYMLNTPRGELNQGPMKHHNARYKSNTPRYLTLGSFLDSWLISLRGVLDLYLSKDVARVLGPDLYQGPGGSMS
jgi:hypothetical protein